MAKGNAKKSKGQHKEDLERKRDERSRRNALKKEKQIKEYLDNDDNFVSFKNQLESIGFKIKDILGDGNCLFRALGDQLNGDHTSHAKHRKETVKYMREHRQDFEPFMEDDITFDKHLQLLSRLGVYGGNDSIVAFARNNGVNVVIHQLNEPRWVIDGSEYSKTGQQIELHISYHNGEHYSSVRRLTDPDNSPAWLYHNRQPVVKQEDECYKRNKKKEKWKEKESHIDTQQTRGACGGPDPPSLEEIVMSATGCTDLTLVLQTLEENNYDVDVSIGFILQIMCLSEDSESAMSIENLNSSDQSSTSPSNTDPSNMDYSNRDPSNGDPSNGDPSNMDPSNRDPINGDPSNRYSSNRDPSNRDPSNRDLSNRVPNNETPSNVEYNSLEAECANNNMDNALPSLDQLMPGMDGIDGPPSGEHASDTTSKTSLNSDFHETKQVSNHESSKTELKEFVYNFRESINGAAGQNISSKSHPGARPKQISKTIRNNSSHLSNRQRKEQAQKEKKKRREERRKEGTVTKVMSEEMTSEKVATVMADLGALAI